MQAMMVASEPAKAEVATKAESLKAQAQSLEARAEAQNLQVRLFIGAIDDDNVTVLQDRR